MIDRYYIGDPICGLVMTADRKQSAMILAKRHKCEDTTIHDRAAHYGKDHEWLKSG